MTYGLASPNSSTTRPTEIVNRKHPGRWISAAVMIVLAAMLINSLITNQSYDWGTVGHYLFSGEILQGLLRTVELTAAAMAIGVVLGTIIAIMRLSQARVARTASQLFIWFFRGTPLLVQLIFWYNLGALYSKLGLGIPFGPQWVSASTNDLITVWTAAMLGLGLNEAAYMAEFIRGGLLSVPKGQREAAMSIGMSQSTSFRRVIMPQALRVIVPAIGNQTISMLKSSSLVSVLALPELLYSAQLIYSQNFRTIPLLIVCSIWYLVLTSLLTLVQVRVEKHFGKGSLM